MFNSIADILGKFTPQQRIIALLLVLFTITIVSVGPQLIESLKPIVPEEYAELVESQNKKIQSLSSEIVDLNNKIVEGNQQCTNRLIDREREIATYIDELIRMGQYSMRENQLMVINDTISTESSTPIVGNSMVYNMVTALQSLRDNLGN
jgi:predicted PurR-regulated permease PerM